MERIDLFFSNEAGTRDVKTVRARIDAHETGYRKRSASRRNAMQCARNQSRQGIPVRDLAFLLRSLQTAARAKMIIALQEFASLQ